jgi:hypothetical protein
MRSACKWVAGGQLSIAADVPGKIDIRGKCDAEGIRVGIRPGETIACNIE